MLLRQIFDPKLAQYAYLVGCQRTGEALVIDPERDVDRYLELAAAEGLRITAVAETHIHADFLSGARELAERHGVKVYLSDEGGKDWKYEWTGGYDVRLLGDGDTFEVGGVELKALHTPGHTPEHLSFLVIDRGSGAREPMGMATGDFVFVGDLGRPDLLESAAGEAGAMEPSARELYRSVGRFMTLPDFVLVWPAHGAGSSCGKSLGAVPWSTVGYEKRHNGAIEDARHGEAAFVEAILEDQPEPPLYFATMKKLNKQGPPLLGDLPRPERRSASDLAGMTGDGEPVVIDTRSDRDAFMAAHLDGSLFAPLDNTFPTIVGSYVMPREEIVLVVDDDRLEEAVRALVRIGYDRVTGHAPPDVLDAAELADRLRKTPVIDFAEVERRRRRKGVTVLDVRRASEYEEGHVAGALNIAHTRLRERLGEVPRGDEILVHCQSGARAATAAALLERAGRDVRFVNDHFKKRSEKSA